MTGMPIDDKLQTALQRLLAGRPERSDGKLTVKNLCAEAEVSRASFYRSPRAADIQQTLTDPPGHLPEAEELRRQVKQLKAAGKQLRSQHATEVRDLRDQAKTYANQIQVLTLRLAQLADDNTRLLARTERDAGITRLPVARPVKQD
jgi:hypothetical protein